MALRKTKTNWKDYYHNHRNKRLLASNEYYRNNTEKVLIKKRIFNKENADKILTRNRLYKYKLTNKQFQILLKKQGGKCICGKNINKPNECSIDHDHTCCPNKKTCGECIRGLLCKNCNLALGYTQDNPEILLKLTGYLYNYKPNRNSRILMDFIKYISQRGQERF